MLLIREIPPPSYKHNFYSTFSLQVKLEILIPLAQERLRVYIYIYIPVLNVHKEEKKWLIKFNFLIIEAWWPSCVLFFLSLLFLCYYSLVLFIQPLYMVHHVFISFPSSIQLQMKTFLVPIKNLKPPHTFFCQIGIK